MSNIRIRAPNGSSFWDLTGIDWNARRCSRPSDREDRWVRWNGREWLRKSDERSLSEIAGYQVAEAIDAPVQSWAAFFERESGGAAARTGILIERIDDADQSGRPAAFVDEFPQEVARLLAWTVFQRLDGEEPELIIGRNTSLRWIDLDGYGPHFRRLTETTDTKLFNESSESVFARTTKVVSELRLDDWFLRFLNQLLACNPAQVFEFSGHPDHAKILKITCESFRGRAEKTRKMLSLRARDKHDDH
jgi:hypothetical protein